jgi:hypothetical protein
MRAPSLLPMLLLVACTGDKADDTGGFAEPCNPVTLDAAACDPDQVSFTLDSTNPWYPLIPGLSTTLEGYDADDDVTLRVERVVTDETRTIDGVEVHVLEHREYHDDVIYEIAYNFYVESTAGTVCYFGEDVEFYEDGAFANTDGTWRVGEGGAKPGIIMPASPAVGDVYYQEVAPGVAEDMGRVSATGEAMTIGGAAYTGVLVIQDSNPIDDEDVCEEERKLYVSGIGEVADVDLELIDYTVP